MQAGTTAIKGEVVAMPSFSCTVDYSIPQGLRLDRYVAEYLKILSRSQIKARKLSAAINGKPVKISRILSGGEHLDISWEEAESFYLLPQNLPLDIVYEDSRVIVINKEQGMVVHPGAGNRQGTLANALFYRMLEKNGMQPDFHTSMEAWPHPGNNSEGASSFPLQIQPGIRPGIVHRLDKDTSGVIIAALDNDALAFLASQFKARTVRKSYAALVLGCPKDAKGCINKRIARSIRNRKIFTTSENYGRPSVTCYKLIKTYGKYSLLLIRPKTGRTHQIRVHLKYLGTPILGDSLYGREDPRFKSASLMLHAKRLSIILPPNFGTIMPPCGISAPGMQKTFRTPLPARFRKIIESL